VHDDIPSVSTLPAKIHRTIAHLAGDVQEKWLCLEEQVAERLAGTVSNGNSALPYGLGPGILNLHLVTDEWVRDRPLWKGPGSGLFLGQEAPTTKSEFVGCLMFMFVHLFDSAKSSVIDTYASRADEFLDFLTY
jgi:hypothetical protein